MVFPSFFSKKKQKKYYFGLQLKSDSANGFVYLEENANVSLVAQQNLPYTNAWEQILEDSDKLISELENKVGEPLDEVIFFIPTYFVDASTGEVKKQYKDIIKNISKALELKLLGFIELHEAVKSSVLKKNQAPLNSIFVELDSVHQLVFGYKGDKEILKHQSARTESLYDDLTEVFKTVETGSLPSKITLYGDGRLEEEAIVLEKADWDTKTFLHPPKVDFIKEEEIPEIFRAVFAEQILSEPVINTGQDNTTVVVDEKPQHNELLGFVVGEDIRTIQPNPPAETLMANEPLATSPSKFNFAIPKISLPFKFGLPQKKGGLIIASLVLLTLVGSAFGVEYFFHKMNVTVYLPAEELKKTIELSAPVSKTQSNNFYVKLSEMSKDLTEETKTTGEQEVGQKAKGKVVVHNFDNAEKTIPKGTEIVYENLSYVLDQDVKVASSSGITSSGTKQSGKANGSVTAAKIGPEFNIDKGKQLRISGLSDSLYIAISEDSFSGGTKKKVKTVARTDVEKLKTAVTAKAKEQGADQIKVVGSGEQVLGDLTKVDVEDTQYTKEIGEEGDVLGLKAKANIEYYTYPVNTFKEALVSSLSADAPAGYSIQADKLNYKVKKAKKTSDDTVTLTIDTEVNLVKDIPKEEITKAIAGKSSSKVPDIVKKQFEAKDYSIDKTYPTSVLFSNWTPLFKKNIGVTISSK